ncbi:branched-chain amino acid ABC transporter permease [Rhizobacter sp. Root404]|uniref:branched-chain amino acid ABC transporter permease n=1 Tax=Rhizobacter sp. Root404 TaxID=1736528 RepID=UPI0006F1D6FC|nr:branched-chain amino acid ABC transporter permease [Rhizobacter sp. Root404]KQW38395.1 ABC transporter permease [Rhizobacter sp. Root404]
MLIQQAFNALSLGCIYALFALGFTLVFGVLGVINLAQGALFALGAFVALEVTSRAHLGIVFGACLGILASGVAGALVDATILRVLRNRNAPHLMPMIATIGVGITTTSILQGLFGAENRRFPLNDLADKTLQVGEITVTALELVIIFSSFLLMATLWIVIRYLAFGRALRAVAESPKASHLIGINVEAVFRNTSFLAGALGGAAGVLIALHSNAIFPLMGQAMLHKGIAVIILGGLGDIRGAMLAGLCLGIAETGAVVFVGSSARDAVAYGLLFLVLLVRPSGLFGSMQERKA